MKPAVTYEVSQADRALLEELHTSDRETGGRPSVRPNLVASAREYLSVVLLDFEAQSAHLRLLEEFYETKFDNPELSRRLMEGQPVYRIEAAAGFPHKQLSKKADDVAQHGPSVLESHELAELLLNPLALWDLADLIDFLQPGYWLPRMEEVGRALMTKSSLGVFSAVPADASESAG